MPTKISRFTEFKDLFSTLFRKYHKTLFLLKNYCSSFFGNLHLVDLDELA